ncbi:zinc finger MYM-type protein 1 [Tanacetum coccineum]
MQSYKERVRRHQFAATIIRCLLQQLRDNNLLQQFAGTKLSHAGCIAEQMGGISYLEFLKDLEGKIDEQWNEISMSLEQIRGALISKKGCLRVLEIMPPRLRKHALGHSKHLKRKKTEESNKKEFGSMHRYVKIKSNVTNENLNVDTSDSDSSNDESGDDVNLNDTNVENIEADNINYNDDVDNVDEVDDVDDVNVCVNDHDHDDKVKDRDGLMLIMLIYLIQKTGIVLILT